MELNLLVSSSPHIKSQQTTKKIMRDVLIALIPATIAAAIFFGIKILLVVLVTVLSCIVSEYLWTKIFKKKSTINDLSAIVTGVLLALNLTPTIPLWIAVIGGFFAIFIVKMPFGGLGHNFINPALAARAFLMASWPVQMTLWQNSAFDMVSTATPLTLAKGGTEAVGSLPSIFNLFIGNVGGCIGETSALALLIGAIYLIIKKVITLEIPLTFIGTVALLTWIFGGENLFEGDFLFQILAGGLMLGAFYMATDYTTSPITSKGKVIMGVGCGLITAVIRLYGGYPEGVSYSILLMNLVVPLIDKFIIPKSFGGKKL